MKLGSLPTQREHTGEAQQQFDAHDCEKFALENWKSTDGTTEN